MVYSILPPRTFLVSATSHRVNYIYPAKNYIHIQNRKYQSLFAVVSGVIKTHVNYYRGRNVRVIPISGITPGHIALGTESDEAVVFSQPSPIYRMSTQITFVILIIIIKIPPEFFIIPFDGTFLICIHPHIIKITDN